MNRRISRQRLHHLALCLVCIGIALSSVLPFVSGLMRMDAGRAVPESEICSTPSAVNTVANSLLAGRFYPAKKTAPGKTPGHHSRHCSACPVFGIDPGLVPETLSGIHDWCKQITLVDDLSQPQRSLLAEGFRLARAPPL